jgi:glycosyltransferase domain-containing protein
MSLLTIVIPTRDRPHNLPGQLRLFQRTPYPAIVADSSDPDNATFIRSSLPGTTQYRGFAPTVGLYEKLAPVLQSIDTPFVLLAADRKITFPHAIDPLLQHLIANEAHVAAMGYVLGFSVSTDEVDINRIVFFTPTIGETDPLQRHYHLMRRYQAWTFCVFRTVPLLRAVTQANRVRGPIFQEMLMMNALVLQGKMARLPVILSLQTQERSFHPPTLNDPFFWFLDNISSFFTHYLDYRTTLTEFIRELDILVPAPGNLEQLVDMIHAVWLHRNFDNGMLNHAARLLLGDTIPRITGPEVQVSKQSCRDKIAQRVQRYIWRDAVLSAEPRHEISISEAEMDQVMDQADIYFK